MFYYPCDVLEFLYEAVIIILSIQGANIGELPQSVISQRSTHFTESIKIAPNKDVHGVAKYKFEIKELSTDPNSAVSDYTIDDPMNEANAIIQHYEDAVEVCKEIRKDQKMCWRELKLNENGTEFTSCLAKIEKWSSYQIYKEDGYPPRIILDHPQHVPPNVQAACNKLNSAIAASFDYVYSDSHKKTSDNLTVVKNHLHSEYMRKSAELLEKCKHYIDCLKEQSKLFLHDFSAYATTN